jgi:Dyp-type peroxidase family
MLAADDAVDLRAGVSELAVGAASGAELVSDQRGAVLPGPLRGHEHFGFLDGVAQPGVYGFHPEDHAQPGLRADDPGTRLVQPGEFVLGHPTQDGPPRAAPGWMADGSFQVFRRLAQDVPGWRTHLAALCATLPAAAGVTPELLAAQVVGRWPDGTPLAVAPTAGDCGAGAGPTNDFDFTDDPDGRKTPHFSHIRKMNPRGEFFNDDRRRIIRRGIPYGLPFAPGSEAAERGLLFNAYMASIEGQFEFLQRLWANTDDFPRTHAGADALIGSPLPPAPAQLARPDGGGWFLTFQRFIRTTGAVYAFLPSVPTFRALAAGEL